MNFLFFCSEYYVNGCVVVFVVVVVVVVVFFFFFKLLGPRIDAIVGNKTLSS